MNQPCIYGRPKINGDGKKLSRLKFKCQEDWIHCDSNGRIEEKGKIKIYNTRSPRRDTGIKKKDSTLDIASENELTQQETIIENPNKNTEETMISESVYPNISSIEDQNSNSIPTENYDDFSFEVNMDTQYNHDANNHDSSWLDDAINSAESSYHSFEHNDYWFDVDSAFI